MSDRMKPIHRTPAYGGRTVQPAALVSDEMLEELLALDALLRRMEAEDPHRARIVECRVFGGMSLDEVTEALDLSPAVVQREWRIASARLYRQLQSRANEP